MIENTADFSKSVIEVYEIETSIGTFICGTIFEKCSLFEFKDRKSISDIMKRQTKKFSIDYVEQKNELRSLTSRRIGVEQRGQGCPVF